MSGARFIVGDVFDVLTTLEPASVDLVLTSPPFLALRSYLPADHPDKGKEIGGEATPADYIDTLLDVTEACRRVLAPHGSLVFELGDTYSGSGGAGGDYNADGLRAGQEKFTGSASRSGWHRQGRRAETNMNYRKDGTVATSESVKGGVGWPLDKSLCGIPTLFAWSLAYGRNLLRPERETERWRVRNVVAWCRPNPPVGALGDKFRPATSYLTVASMVRDRWFDLDAVRTEHKSDPTDMGRTMGAFREHTGLVGGDARGTGFHSGGNPVGAPPLDYWVIPTQPYKGAHYATWPEALCARPTLSMCPRRVCVTCGEPSRRIVGDAEYHQSPNAHGSGRAPDDVAARKWESGIAKGKNQSAELRDGGVVRVAPTLGWTDCGHDDWRPGVVLDPFAGSGTTLAAAVGHGRDAIGIDLDARNADLAAERVGMFLTVEHLTTEGVA